MAGCKIIRVKNVLGEQLSKPGGISKDEAVAEAKKLIEELREDCEKAVPVEITRMEDMVGRAGASVSRFQLLDILSQVDPLLTLAGTFGSPTLDAVVKRFCDLVAGMIEHDITDSAPLEVHLRAMRLVFKTELGDAENAAILAELSRIHAHYGIESHADDMPPPEQVPV
jgi:hypothetical protein